MDTCLYEMIDAYQSNKTKFRLSEYWKKLNKTNIAQLENSGYENFKQTVGRNYFIWLDGIKNSKVKFLVKNLPISQVLLAFMRAFLSKKHSYFSAKQCRAYNFVTFMLWEYVIRQAAENIAFHLEESLEGNPPYVKLKKKRISQDLAFSMLEFLEISRGVKEFSNINTIVELGAGYGRTAFVFLTLMPNIRYIIADVPPALYLSQRYLTGQFPTRRIFKFRDFKDYSEVAADFQESQIAFLLPHQLELLPNKIADLFLAIDSLHEMPLEQIEYYFSIVDRLVKDFFYFKCWKETVIPCDNIKLTEKDYPIRDHWDKIFWQECKVLTLFFEALIRIKKART